MEDLSVFILTLPDSKRFKLLDEYMKENKINYIKILGLKGEEVKSNNLSFFCNHFCTRSIKGCGVSHLKIFDYIKNNVKTNALVIEDDTFVNFKELKYLYPKLKKYLNNGIIQLVGNNLLLKNKIILDDTYSLNNYRSHLLLGSYIISRTVAEKLSNLKLNYHIDLQLNTLGLVNYVIEPNISIQKGWESSNMITKGKIFKTRDYTLFMPMIKIPFLNIVINFVLIFFFLITLVLYLFGFFNEPILFLFLGIFFSEILIID